MGRIVHLAMRVDDLDKATEFYTKIFGFKEVRVPGLRTTARYLTDGRVHIALNQARGAEDAGPAIDHFGIEVENVDRCTAEIGKYGGAVVSEPGKAVKYRDPGGIVVEAVPVGAKPGIDEK
ncbi:MAG TPA: VOC family protein [Candidatus Acidoferrales bacterium]|nr:VOC family protein [Candidatus Acidoferrales bacterium]